MKARNLSVLIVLIGLSWLSEGCNHDNENVAVPRPRTYPRLQETEAVYIPVADAPHGFTANSSTIVNREENHGRGNWFTVSYPQYGNAKVYFTFTPVDTSNYDETIENRLKRISLNFGEAPFTIKSISTPNGWEGAIFTTREAVALPVQFLVTHPGTVVSGSLFVPDYAVNPDSMRPAVETISRDITHSLFTLE